MDLTEIRNIHIKEYNYELPENRIAKYPLKERDQSKLLVYRNGNIEDSSFTSLPDYLPTDSLIVFNNTRVIQARMIFRKDTGATIEIFCLEPHSPHDYNLIFQSTEKCSWLCMIGNLKKWKEGVILSRNITIGDCTFTLNATRVEMQGTSHLVEFTWNETNFTFADILDNIGELPIPPYLKRDTEEEDKETYQTLYSKIKGSVAAPTAGLHFTESVFDKLRDKGIQLDEVTLHVGTGTFKPVKSETIDAHEMHSEFISVRKELIENLLNHKGKIVAVGTTSVRTLESLYQIGSALGLTPDLKELSVSQWQPYERSGESDISKEQSLKNILEYLNRNKLDRLLANTQIMIVPGYEFKIVDAIVTNFHQPQSTLLLLVSAFVEGNWKSIYSHALSHGYRFLSYGDSSLLLR